MVIYNFCCVIDLLKCIMGLNFIDDCKKFDRMDVVNMSCWLLFVIVLSFEY